MTVVWEWFNLSLEVWGYIEPVLKKRNLKAALQKRGKSKDEAQVYILGLEFMRSDYVKMIFNDPDALKVIPNDPMFQSVLPLFFEVVFDDECAAIWFKDRDRIVRMRQSILSNNWIGMMNSE